MKKLERNEIKKIQLDILKYIDDICEKNNINYTLIGGSLIGAIRHKGMIPWDDDIDIGLTKDNYNKLIQILTKNNNSQYKLLNHSTTNNYYYAFSKLVDTNTKLKEKNFEEIEDYGLYIDIFCYYNIPNLNCINNYFKKQNYYNSMLGGIKKVPYEKNILKYFAKIIRHLVVKIVGSKYYFNKLDKLHSKYEKNIDSEYVLSDWNVYSLEKELKKKNLFDEYMRVNFDGVEVSIIKKYDEFLKGTFGDYMKMPDEKDRRTHDLVVYRKEK